MGCGASTPAPARKDAEARPAAAKASRRKLRGVAADVMSVRDVGSYVAQLAREPKSAAEVATLRKAMRGCQILARSAGDEDIFAELALVAKRVELALGEAVYAEGEVASTWYVLVAGACSGERGPGAEFGSPALLYDQRRAGTVSCCSEQATLLSLDRLAYRSVVLQIHDQRKKQYEEFLRKVPLFAEISDVHRSRLADALKPVMFASGASMCVQGEPGSNFFIIMSGEVAILVADDACPEGKEVVRRQEGDYFGEISLLSGAPVTATCQAVDGEVMCLAMGQKRFKRLFGTNFNVKFREYSSDTSSSNYVERRNLVPANAAETSLKNLAFWDGANLNTSSFENLRTLGLGAFGQVHLAKYEAEPAKFFAVKRLAKAHVVDSNQVQHTLDEVAVMSSLSGHPNIVRLCTYFTDTENVYLVMEFANGGELYSLIQHEYRLTQAATTALSAEILSALAYLHGQNIMFRDLKPENVLLNERGSVKLADFGLAKRSSERTYTVCGTPDYMAPEILLNLGHGTACDYWALGCMVFEMLTGLPPFYDEEGIDPMETVKKILNVDLDLSEVESSDASDLIRALLCPEVTKRLGCMAEGADGVRSHAFFSEINWDAIEPAPLPPALQVDGPLDCSNFDDFDADAAESAGLANNRTLTSAEQAFFDYL